MNKNNIIKLDKAIEIVDKMYQDRMSNGEPQNNINVSYSPEFTDLELASVRLLREVIKLQRELDKKDKVIDLMAKSMEDMFTRHAMKKVIVETPEKPAWVLIKETYIKKVEEENE